MAQDLLHRRQADPLPQGHRGECVPQHLRAHGLGDPHSVGHRLDDVLGAPRLDRERLLQREVVLQERPHRLGLEHAATAFSNCQALRTVWGAEGALALENQGDRLSDPFQGLGA